MTVYADASVIVSAFVDEVNSEAADAWLFALDAGDLTSSWWCVTEVASAIAGKVRRLQISAAEGQRYFGAARDLLMGSAIVIDIEHRHFELAADLLRRSESPLRASDALHLAIADDAGATLYTLDRRMAEAGQALGLAVQLLGTEGIAR